MDTQPPTLTGCTTSQGPFTAANGATNLAVSFTEPTFGNDFPDVPIVTKSHVPGDAFVDGTTTVNYTATDLAGKCEQLFHGNHSDKYVKYFGNVSKTDWVTTATLFS